MWHVGRVWRSRRSHIEAVVFDAGRTLFSRGGPQDMLQPGDGLLAAAERVGLPHAALQEVNFRTFWKRLEPRTGALSASELGSYNSAYFQHTVLPDLPPKLRACIREGRLAQLPPYDVMRLNAEGVAVVPQMRRIARAFTERGLQISVLSDNVLMPGGAEPLSMFGAAWSGFRADFPALADVLNSCEVGVAKPDAKIFRLACERLGRQPHQVSTAHCITPP